MDILRKTQDNLEDIIDDYINMVIGKLKNYKEHLTIKGKNIEVANAEQASYLAYYDELKVEVKAIKSKYECKVAEAKANAWKLLIDHSKVSHSDREKEVLVNTNVNYIKVKNKLLEIEELYDILDSISKQFVARGYSLNNIARIRVAALEDVTIYD